MASNYVVTNHKLIIKPENFRDFLKVDYFDNRGVDLDKATPEELLELMKAYFGWETFQFDVLEDGTLVSNYMDVPYSKGNDFDEFWTKAIKFCEPQSFIDMFDDSDYDGVKWYYDPERGRHTDWDLEQEAKAKVVTLNKSELERVLSHVWDLGRDGKEFTQDAVKSALELVGKELPKGDTV